MTWEASANATDYLVARREPSTETFFTAIATNVVGTTYTDSTGLVAGTLYEYFIIAQRNPSSEPSQVVQATAGEANLTAYRPQGVYDPDDTSTPNPMYHPFPRRPVDEFDEGHHEVGPGIRINTDDDDNNGIPDSQQGSTPITRENDLIEVKVDRLPGQTDMVLTKHAQLSLYFDHGKENAIPLDVNGNTTLPLPFTDNTLSVWVEWVSTTHSIADISLYELANPTSVIDTIRFHSFESLIIVFGGNTQNPADTSGDGSIGDTVNGATGNREGIFDIAQYMYDTGWDVLAFDEEDVDAGDDIPYTEVINARQQRFVERHGIIGYSQGGGATHDLIERVYADHDIITNIGVFLDAVDHDGFFAENDWPDVVFYLLSFYQTNSFLNGGDIDDNEVLPGATLEEINTTTDPEWDNTLNHSLIDDDLDIGSRIIFRLNQILIDR